MTDNGGLVDRLLEEGLVTLQQAAKAVGIQVSDRQMRYWAEAGIRGAVLESMMVGGRRLTSSPALRRFLDAINADSGNV